MVGVIYYDLKQMLYTDQDKKVDFMCTGATKSFPAYLPEAQPVPWNV